MSHDQITRINIFFTLALLRVDQLKFIYYKFNLIPGNNYINVWDILGGGRLLKQFSSQQKTVTTMCFNGDYTRLLSGSLDRYVVHHMTINVTCILSTKALDQGSFLIKSACDSRHRVIFHRASEREN